MQEFLLLSGGDTVSLSDYPPNVQKFLLEMIKRNVISMESLSDKTLINYLCTQKYDDDYIDSMAHDH